MSPSLYGFVKSREPVTPEEVARELAARYARCDRVGLSMPYAVPIETLTALVAAAASL